MAGSYNFLELSFEQHKLVCVIKNHRCFWTSNSRAVEYSQCNIHWPKTVEKFSGVIDVCIYTNITELTHGDTNSFTASLWTTGQNNNLLMRGTNIQTSSKHTREGMERKKSDQIRNLESHPCLRDLRCAPSSKRSFCHFFIKPEALNSN